MATSHRYSSAEEMASSITHGLGVLLGVTALVLLTVLAAVAGDGLKVFSFALYGSTLLLMYLSSTLYHSLRDTRLKGFFRRCDHLSIYLLIAGTYTPFTLVNLRGSWGWTMFGLVWGIAVIGVIVTLSKVGRSRTLASVVYVCMGWMVVVAIKPLLKAVPGGGIAWLVAGGLFYTLGVIFYLWDSLPFNHAIWHVFVLGGSVCHFVAVFFYVLPG